MKTDLELLALAAKAAGIEIQRSRLEDPLCRDMLVKDSARNTDERYGSWNPLTDCGDALRLAVKLNMRVSLMPGFDTDAVLAVCDWYARDGSVWAQEPFGDDKAAATRRAITRAAAAIGEKL